MTCHYRLWITHTVVPYWVGHAFIAFGLHTLSDDVRRCMTAWALGSVNGEMTLDLTCHHRPWVSHTVGLCRAWHAHITHRQHTWSDDIECCIPLSPLSSTHNHMTSYIACHHRPWESYMVRRCQALHAIITLGKHTQLDYIGHGMQ